MGKQEWSGKQPLQDGAVAQGESAIVSACPLDKPNRTEPADLLWVVLTSKNVLQMTSRIINSFMEPKGEPSFVFLGYYQIVGSEYTSSAFLPPPAHPHL